MFFAIQMQRTCNEPWEHIEFGTHTNITTISCFIKFLRTVKGGHNELVNDLITSGNLIHDDIMKDYYEDRNHNMITRKQFSQCSIIIQ